MAHDVERVFADIDADHGDRGTGCLGHGVLPVLAPLASLSLAGQEHGRTIPLADILSRTLLALTFEGERGAVCTCSQKQVSKVLQVRLKAGESRMDWR
ncbi:hypothetical protein E4K65_16105 [Bradyrhizobium niftali]|uniref:Uncharacterized protein n=1 Tax=Bradyrhizobium niftali TaxID=2560055 RepID=A0A4Y9LXY5_9BRAD|nr:hypothetical protein E4K65_16105 [Bradyrhizobium niftali]